MGLKITGAVGDKSKKTKKKAENNDADVRVVQRLLKKHGFYGGLVDGDCGRQTMEAIRLFQRRRMNDRSPDGRRQHHHELR